jgi:glucose/arabinose dehydrogenase
VTRFSFACGSLVVLGWLAPSPARALTLAAGAPQESFDVTVLANGLSEPTDVAELPDGRVVIVQRLGDVLVVQADGTTQIEAGRITVNPDFSEQGLLGVVADPAFATNSTLYFYASVGSDYANKHKVYKITLGADSRLDSGRDTIISQGLRSSLADSPAGFGNHNGGGLFIFENFLYVSVGDTGHNATPPTNRLGTCLNSPNGKILRVGLDGSIPSNNPLSAETMVTGCTGWNQNLTQQAPDRRIFFWGLRNPWRFWIDAQTKRAWIADVGEGAREELSVSAPLDAQGAQGQHFGWPFREGTVIYTTQQQSWQPQDACMGVSPARECVAPVYDYAHNQGNNCIVGGLIPDGCGWESPWTSRYIFGDNGSGRVWTLNVNGARDGVDGASRADFASSQGIGSFRMGAKGVLYVAEVGGGVVSKVTPKGLDPSQCSPPGAGGAGGSGGTAGAAGTTGGTGGDPPTSGGASGAAAGGAPATGGSATGGSAAGAPATGGSGTGGSGTGTGGATTPPSGSGEPSGCGCRAAGSGRYGMLIAVGGLALFGGVLRGARRRRRKNER